MYVMNKIIFLYYMNYLLMDLTEYFYNLLLYFTQLRELYYLFLSFNGYYWSHRFTVIYQLIAYRCQKNIIYYITLELDHFVQI